MKKSITLSILIFGAITSSYGQIRDCLTVPMDSMRRANNPGLGTKESFESWLSNRMQTSNGREQLGIYRIPVVVHVTYNGEAVGQGANISFEQIQSQIEVLNEDFRKMSGTNGFNNHPVGADAEIEFYLAKTDPDGNILSEPGVDRVNGGRAVWPTGISQSIETQLKPNTIWDPDRYFNMWTVNFGGFIGRNLLGYAQFPDMSGLDGLNESGGSAQTDGIVVGYQYFGSSEKGDFPELRAPYDLGRTTTHEVGHWLGLRHIWGDGNCTVDDFVADTPRAAEYTVGCPSDDVVTCTQPSMYENYMDYTNDGCMNIFTQGQKDRMIAVLENSPRRPSNLDEEVLSAPPQDITSLMVYPNPADLYVNIRSSSLDLSEPIQISNISGQQMVNYRTSLQDEKIHIQVDRLPTGVYFLELISQDQKKKTTRFIISR